MNADIRLEELLRTSEPLLCADRCVFCTLQAEQLPVLAGQCLLLVCERDGYSAVLPRELAEREGLASNISLCRITLRQPLDQARAELLVALTSELAHAQITARLTSTPFGHHLFVPEHQAEDALRLLRAIGNRAQYC
ncbi:ACT domain-containing protein [Microbulbifer yueqingensis]|uniref:DUF2241 domain-containing protein n=1 Tax=Microbulbifer yueqingensis TaxID=658219 RepID=A0A1G9C0W6_9GAMM|nr:ACT domain-containing protein [Microbulbifer yueqingensis]SDK45104.1 hypothetical protein SAMN05216212_2429 [Microbulbifer yueqingensis]